MKKKPGVCRSAKRVVHIEGQEWRYSIGFDTVHIYGPDGVQVLPPANERRKLFSVGDILGTDVERDRYKGNFHGVKPSDMKKFIEANLVMSKKEKTS